jgi:prepilin-type N-terminal cleavage/methylation domain-containing protein/prepilin-type processing-associated H-X9-DG protein
MPGEHLLMHIRTRKAFTLIELLVVIAIIAILAAILFPVFAQAREKARAAHCASNMKQIMTGVRMYAQDYDEQSPEFWAYAGATHVITWMEMIHPYVADTEVFICASAPRAVSAYTPGCVAAPSRVASSYVWPSWVRYSAYTWQPGLQMFAGFPTPRRSLCVNPWDECRGTETVAYPAEAAFLLEGHVINYNTAASPFGSACTTGYSTDASNRNFYRHNEGMNIAYCDGHVKWVNGRRFNGDNTAWAQYGGARYPQSPHMRVGN